MQSRRCYSVLPFPYEGHALFSLVDGSYAHKLSRSLLSGVPVELSAGQVRLELLAEGRPMDVSLTPMGIPVLSPRAVEVLSPLIALDVQLLPCTVACSGRATREMFIANVISRVDCLRADADMTPMDGEFGVLDVSNLRIDSRAVGTHHMFRVVGSDADLIVTHEVRLKVEATQLSGPPMLSLDEENEQVMPGVSMD